jgi:predicted flap endonuclease-1-like 5' DNA nuclease
VVQIVTNPTAVAAVTLLLQTDESSGGIPWWVWFILIALLLLLLLIGIMRQSEPGEPLPKPEERVAASVVVAEEMSAEEAPEEEPEADEAADVVAAPEAASPPPETDDLKRIEGIGPKISSILNENGITTFAALAATEQERLQEILDEAGIRMAHPGTWSEQARLAAAGQWDELETLQSNLKGGRQK